MITRLRAGLLAALTVLPLVALAPAAGAVRAQEPAAPRGTGEPLELGDVLSSIEGTYPPLLGALIERDLREGRLRTARGVFDLDLFGKVGGTPDGYYEYSTVEAGVEQFLGLWGSSVYGGYRLTDGETLPDYYSQRTQGAGEATVGVRVPILRGGATDKARTELAQAELMAAMADPLIARQRLDFVRAGSVAYFKWLASGRKLQIARELLRVTLERTAGLEQQVADGFRAEIDLVDNRRLVASRELEVIEAERDFQLAALSLSLFYRTEDGEPVTPGEESLPQGFPPVDGGAVPAPDTALTRALERRPELQTLGIELEVQELERRLARNSLLPYLDARVESARPYGEDLYTDRSVQELRGELGFKFPLQNREARGKAQEVDAKLEQARQKLFFATDKVVAEVRKNWAAVMAALDRIDRAELNVELAVQLQAAEAEEFRLGSSDLLALQIREQAAFDAQKKAVDVLLDYFVSVADYRAAIALDLPELPPGS